MEESTGLDEPDGHAPPAPADVGEEDAATEDVVPLANGRRRPEVEAELRQWVVLDEAGRRSALRDVIQRRRNASAEALVYWSRRAIEANDRRMLNLAFEAFSTIATPRLLSQARGMPEAARRDQAQQVLLEAFAAIKAGKADFLEASFAAFAKRRAISLYRQRRACFEGANQRVEPNAESDPLDNIPDRVPSTEVRALLAIALDKLPAKQRAAFIQYHRFEMRQEEIAAHHGVDVRTVRSWLKKAGAALGLTGEKDDRE